MSSNFLTRRGFLRAAGFGLLTPFAVLTPGRASGQSGIDQAAFAINPQAVPQSAFALSVASGDPSPTGVVLWTRVNPEVYNLAVDLAVEVATDPAFQNLATSGVVDPIDFGPDRDYTVHLDLDGMLEAGRVYYYRFIYGGVASRVGRCRTLPLPNDSISRLRLAVLTCQDFSNGYYGALAQVAREDVDFVVHLGDIIYESQALGDSARFPDRQVILPSGQSAAIDLADYRALYRRYRTDPNLQLLMERHTVIVVWDDHETANDCYWDYERDTLGAPDHPFATQNDPSLLRQLKLDSQRAWAEYVPARVAIDPSATHPHDFMLIYRSFRFGNLVELFMSDERTYRTPHPCGEDQRYASTGCPMQGSPTQTMLGEIQREWLMEGITGSTARWKVWGNQVFTGELSIGRDPERDLHLSMDAWDGYEFERQLLMQTFADADVSNLIVLTGDLHSYMASLLKVDYKNRRAWDRRNIVGVELMTPAVTSANFVELLQLGSGDVRSRMPAALGPSNSKDRTLFERIIRSTNPHVHFFNSQAHGYSTVEFTRLCTIYTAYSVDKTQNVSDPTSKVIRKLLVPTNHASFVDLV